MKTVTKIIFFLALLLIIGIIYSQYISSNTKISSLNKKPVTKELVELEMKTKPDLSNGCYLAKKRNTQEYDCLGCFPNDYCKYEDGFDWIYLENIHPIYRCVASSQTAGCKLQKYIISSGKLSFNNQNLINIVNPKKNSYLQGTITFAVIPVKINHDIIAAINFETPIGSPAYQVIDFDESGMKTTINTNEIKDGKTTFRAIALDKNGDILDSKDVAVIVANKTPHNSTELKKLVIWYFWDQGFHPLNDDKITIKKADKLKGIISVVGVYGGNSSFFITDKIQWKMSDGSIAKLELIEATDLDGKDDLSTSLKIIPKKSGISEITASFQNKTASFTLIVE